MGSLGSLLESFRPLLLRLRPHLGPNARRIPGVLRLKPLLRPLVLRVRAYLDPPPPATLSYATTLLPSDRAAELLARRPYRARRGPLRVLHAVGSLAPGGAERQLCNLLVGLVERHCDASLLHYYPLEGDGGHYVPLLERGGVRRIQLPGTPTPGDRAAAISLAQLSDGLIPQIYEQVRLIEALRPDVVHAWMDYTNILTGIAALWAGVPAVVLSTRNMNPTHIPRLMNPWFEPWYRLLASHPRVHLINNSSAGAHDYAQWLGLAPDRFHIIRNGVDFESITPPTASAAAEVRRMLGVADSDPVLAGILRLSDEKQPLLFVEVARRVMATLPAARAVIVGVGALEAQVRAAIAATGHADRFHLLGRRTDTPAILAAADVILLTSRHEGTPNVLLEAQALGRPVVATRAGGTSEALRDHVTGRLCGVSDAAGLTAAVLELLQAPETRRRFGAAGAAWVRQQFGLRQMIDSTIALYRTALRGVKQWR